MPISWRISHHQRVDLDRFPNRDLAEYWRINLAAPRANSLHSGTTWVRGHQRASISLYSVWDSPWKHSNVVKLMEIVEPLRPIMWFTCSFFAISLRTYYFFLASCACAHAHAANPDFKIKHKQTICSFTLHQISINK